MKTIFKGILFIGLLMAISFVEIAKADTLYTGAWSYHFSNNDEINNSTHNMLAYSGDKYIVGTFKNSFSDQTQFAAYELHEASLGNWTGKIYIGASYGYRSCWGDHQAYIDKQGQHQLKDKKACLMYIPVITYTKYKVQPSVLFKDSALTAAIGWQF